MSIAYEINRLKRNKQKVKEQVNVDKDIISEGREFIRGETVRHYPSGIKSMEMSYKDFIPVHTSTESLIETERGGTIISKTLKGNTSQNGTPTPSSPVAVNDVTGEQVVRVCGKNLYNKNNVTRVGASNQNIKFTTALLPNTQYTFNITSNRRWGTIYLYNSSNTQTRTIGNYSDANRLTFTTSASEVKGDFIFMAETNVDISTYDFTGVQLEKGSSASDYQEYQGKDYEINLGKNLLNNSISSQTLNEVTLIANSDGSVTCNGTASATIILNLLSSNLTLQAGTYTLSGCPSGGSVSSKYKLDIYKSSAKSFLTYDSGSGATFTLTEETTFDRVRLVIFSGYTATDLTFYPMLEKSSTATDYAPYFTPIELNKIGNYQDFIRKGIGKNLLEPIMASATLNGVTCTNNGDGSFTLNGTATASTSFRLDQSTYNGTNNLKTYNGTYTLSCSEIENGLDLRVMQNSTWVSPLKMVNSNTPVTGIIDKNNCFIYINVANGKSVNNLTIRPMLEKSSSATSFEPYGYKDKWYIEKNVLKLVVPNAVIGTLQNSNKRFYVNGSSLGSNNILRNTSFSQTYGLYCDILEEKTAGQTWAGTQGISYDYNSGQNRGCLDFAINGLTTVEEYQNALKGKAIYVIANTPEYTLIENEDLIEQLEKIIPLLEGQNNISVSGNLPTGIDVDYIERVNKHLIGNTNESAE